MEPEVIHQSSPIVDPAPPSAPADFSPKKPPKVLFLIGGVAIILVTLALAIVILGKGKNGAPSATTQNTTTVDTTSWPKYTNNAYFYTLTLPPTWTEIKHSPLQGNIALFNVENTATLEITAQKIENPTLDDYLAAQNATSAATIKTTKTSQVKIGQYDGFERAESWSGEGVQVIATYSKIQDMLYTFTLIPAGSTNAITNDTMIRNYHAALASFTLTDSSQLGKDWQTYTSKPIAGLSFSPFTLSYPQTWTLSDNSTDKMLSLAIYRDNYEIDISQKAVGTAVCLFSDSPAFEGSSGDLRDKQYAEFNTGSGTILRRYFNANSGDKSSMFFCEKQANGPYFQTPLTIGGLAYNVPAKYDSDIILEMDSIVKTITVVAPASSPK